MDKLIVKKYPNKVKGDRISLLFLAAIACFFSSAAVIIMVESGRIGSMNGFSAALDAKGVNLINTSGKTWYNCKFFLSDKGNRNEYQAYFIEYTEQDCKFINNLQTQYDCVLFNKANRFLNYDRARNWSVVRPEDKIQIPWTNFFRGQTTLSNRWTNYAPYSAVYSLRIECQRPNGGKSGQIVNFRD